MTERAILDLQAVLMLAFYEIGEDEDLYIQEVAELAIASPLPHGWEEVFDAESGEVKYRWAGEVESGELLSGQGRWWSRARWAGEVETGAVELGEVGRRSGVGRSQIQAGQLRQLLGADLVGCFRYGDCVRFRLFHMHGWVKQSRSIEQLLYLWFAFEAASHMPCV